MSYVSQPSTFDKKAFAIFEGGGVKGLAHIGAVKALKEAQIRLVGVAGTSAGAIVAALIAAGYDADALFQFDRKKKPGLFNVPLAETFLLPEEFAKVQKVRESYARLQRAVSYEPRSLYSVWGYWDRLGNLIANSIPIGIARWWYQQDIDRLMECYTSLGVVGTDKFGDWLNRQIIAKLDPNGSLGFQRPTFKDLHDHGVDIPLKIVATSVTDHKTKIFEFEETPDTAIADAVQASIAIPYLFKPSQHGSNTLVDGGIVSNYPVWLFDAEREREYAFVPTLGFQLALPDPSEEDTRDRARRHLDSLLSIALFGDYSLERRGVRELHDIRIPTNLEVAQFDVDQNTAAVEVSLARERVRESLDEVAIVFPPDERDMTLLLQQQANELLKELQLPADPTLRANVFLKLSADRLALHYSFNMDDSAELGIEFRYGTGGCGRCWEELAPISVDVDLAKQTYKHQWKMSTSLQNRIRKTLKSLICIPLFCGRIVNRGLNASLNNKAQTRKTLNRAFVGVLCFDSDDHTLVTRFNALVQSWGLTKAGHVLNKLAKPVAAALTP